ncbi:hypothetical protein HanXRQr2_Chr17g0790051 [Helianthus annuus]|uniref:Uncharacterized protein n=1 Tax=Helianthus annuus TaxID=4232 RepID=A0A9K3DI99_HELAN|nr:hypothetical protein HanXRQr2_Chr17g0790051 [Helianthus annuus]KAJ0812108.1 hypothetical protein HanPSC8_Chr17g0758171 [Helianthus annuus]
MHFWCLCSSLFEVVNNDDSTAFVRLDPDLCAFRTALNPILPYPRHVADLRL